MSQATEDEEQIMTTATADTMFTTRTAPWMKLGELVDDTKTSADAIKAANLDFTVSLRDSAFKSTAGEWTTQKNRQAIVRDDTDEFFEFVSPGYEILQYREAFDFMDAIEPNYVAAGALHGGRQGFLVVQPGKTIKPAGDDIEMFVVLRTSHDRSRAVEIVFMPLRGLCMNQLTLKSFSRNAKNRWSIPHLSTLQDKMHEAHVAMARLEDYTKSFEKLAKKLQATKLTENDTRNILDSVIVSGGKKRELVIDEVVDLWAKDTERVGFNGTGWGLVNAVSEYLDWRQPSRGGVEHKFVRAIQGYTHTAINRTASLALAE